MPVWMVMRVWSEHWLNCVLIFTRKVRGTPTSFLRVAWIHCHNEFERRNEFTLCQSEWSWECVPSIGWLGCWYSREKWEVPQRHFYVFHEFTVIMNLSGETSLHYASQNGHASLVRSLVDLGAHIHAKSKRYPNVISTCSINSLS